MFNAFGLKYLKFICFHMSEYPYMSGNKKKIVGRHCLYNHIYMYRQI